MYKPEEPKQNSFERRLPQFEQQKKVATQRLGAAEQQAKEALNRRLASIGNLKSGAAVKMDQNITEGLNQQREEVFGNIDAAENQERARLDEAKEGRDFMAGENALQRRLQEKQMEMQGSQFDRSFEQQRSQFDRSFAEQIRQAAFAEKLGLEEHELSKLNTAYNTALSFSQAKSKDAILDAMNMFFPDIAKQFGERFQDRSAIIRRNEINQNRQFHSGGLHFDNNGFVIRRGTFQ